MCYAPFQTLEWNLLEDAEAGGGRKSHLAGSNIVGSFVTFVS